MKLLRILPIFLICALHNSCKSNSIRFIQFYSFYGSFKKVDVIWKNSISPPQSFELSVFVKESAFSQKKYLIAFLPSPNSVMFLNFRVKYGDIYITDPIYIDGLFHPSEINILEVEFKNEIKFPGDSIPFGDEKIDELLVEIDNICIK